MATNISPFKGHGKDAFDLVDELAPQLREIVDRIENSRGDHRQAYITAIKSFSDPVASREKHPDHLKLFQGMLGLALAKAGGNRNMIRYALQSLGVPI